MDQKTTTTKTKSMTRTKSDLTEAEISLQKHKEYTMNVARQLRYPKEYILRIEKATSEPEIDRLMVSARHSIQ